MASEASRKKAEGFVDGIAGDVSDIYGSDGRGHWVESLASALDEAQAEGRAEGERIGAERERWECHRIAATRGEWPFIVASAIAARGPMRGPEEE